MKTLPFSLCTGIALLGSIACGTTNTPASGVSSGGSAPVQTVTGGTGNSGPMFANAGTGSGLMLDTLPSGGLSSGTTSCQPGNTTTISGVVMDLAGKNLLYKIPVSCGCSQLLPDKVMAIGAPTDVAGTSRSRARRAET